MASSRRSGDPPSLPISQTTALPDLPPISALFLIDFDVKKGYTITWSRTIPNVHLSDRVEYKSLPSGLHTVPEDLIYFVHNNAPDGQNTQSGPNTHAGLSAFVNIPTEDDNARNARMIAVGVLVPLSYGRLGRAWRHAQGLKDLAAKLAVHRKETKSLEEYWEENKGNADTERQPSSGTPMESPAITFSELPVPEQASKGHVRNRSGSDGGMLAPAEHKLSPHHPAWSLTRLLDILGPLIFPIHRAALLRQRILISCHAPVHEICDFVYNLSVLSNMPISLSNILPDQAPNQRLRPLFTIGVHDIPFLTEDYEASKRRQSFNPNSDNDSDDADDEAGSGWIACTTDSILAMKDTLWDMLITLPPHHSTHAKERVWPTVESPKGIPVKATQRDLRRYNALRAGLSRPATSPVTVERPSTEDRDDADDAFDKVTEPLSWAALAYNGYMWWASAGEQLRSEEHDEISADAALLADLPLSTSPSPPMTTQLKSARTELAIIAYFHRLTTQLLRTLSDTVGATDEAYPSEDENEALLDEGKAVMVDSRCVEHMGLDVWSGGDAVFVQDLARVYFGRAARIESKGVEVCGVRVC